MIGNYDGDTRDDIAVFRPSNGTWYYIRSSTGSGVAIQWGTAGDIPVAGDFDGDGKTDLTVFRPSNGSWYTLKSSTGTSTVTQWGATCDVPLPADYDGDGKTDIGVRRMETAANYFINSSTGAGVGTVYGLTTDVPANASTFCYLNGALGPCRSATCGPVGGSGGGGGGGGLECKMFKGVSGHGYMVGFQKCGRTASWKAYPYNEQYSQYVVDGDSGALGSWHVVNPKVMGSTTSTTARNSFFSGVTDIRGDCNACVQ